MTCGCNGTACGKVGADGQRTACTCAAGECKCSGCENNVAKHSGVSLSAHAARTANALLASVTAAVQLASRAKRLFALRTVNAKANANVLLLQVAPATAAAPKKSGPAV
ncbi:hypothetical protein FRB90_004814 [Tulasnella sp. 427]|nr:hypothetical protein FRB90_004814 [Tulasnella sp. 427]